MACDLPTIQAAACVSGIAKEQNKIKLLQLIAQLTCEASQGGGGGGGNPGGADTQVQYNDAGSFGGDAGFTYDGAGAVTVSTSVTVPLVASAGALSFASNGVTRANFSTAGHLLFNADNTNDIGASGATRPRSVYVGSSVVVGVSTSIGPSSIASGGSISSFSTMAAGTALSSGTTLSVGTSATIGTTLRLGGFTVGTLPAAGTVGRTAYVTDASAPTFLGALVGGGAVRTPVFDNGTAWVSA